MKATTLRSALLLSSILVFFTSPQLQAQAASDSSSAAAPATELKEGTIQDLLEKRDRDQKKDEASRNKSEDKKETEAEIDFLKALDYPELQVVPKATERLVIEAKEEKESGWRANWQFWLSGLTTLSVATMSKGQMKEDLTDQNKQDLNTVVLAGQVVGAGWLSVGLWMSFYSPYRDGVNKVQALPRSKDKRSELLRERLAEEAMERPAYWVRKTRWLATITQLATNLALHYYLKPNGQMYALGGAVVSFIPVFFDHRYIETYDRHQQYKKQIYTPLTQFYLLPQPSGTPLAWSTFTWNF